MKEHQRLEKLMALRQQRLRRAENALAEQQQRCRRDAEQLAAMTEQLASQRQDFDRHEQAWFEATANDQLSAPQIDDVRQAMDDHYRAQAALHAQHNQLNQQYQLHLSERDKRSIEWARCVRSQRALEMLQDRHRDTQQRRLELHAELETEDATSRGGR
ncbi:hypothetical protein [Halomonas binhaiensis]|uniref:Flagellar FliJ protein n=1 Tax=Halomonas binhaiensis TaxID=2562282 RepID=A0A5C1NJL3_9GAMM|nr:hypothetical protein [Halomonas binhaiensis]QEM82578.1 hypothetical protein E4T21_14255 [Halomonas binhaiensis]